ncbi:MULTISPECIES: YlaF family protein [unclassified Bacillus (in: firmicutes)]|uniref:YlaF family protein n=1 Tax=unclassified Bacillus (in: firmicutes) TaxID=185979 RepID=UPI0008E6DE8A|nr:MULTISPECIES: YlaF family protein [unclassified Bacillus (in: firmicutes)]SFA76279.1 hypothetical protein SAMN02799634_101581 [Bacillus sp. UNCCL13]SFQ66159.1 hypothetical protein SAMN04488577_0856 [Bacillus sp. cl95]
MKNIKWPFLGFAILAAASIMGIGIAIGERSIWGALISVITLIFVMGMGFKTKKKYRENGLL